MRLLALLLLPALSFAQVPHTFQNGDVADANAVNANFQNLDSRIQVIEDAGGGGCSVAQLEQSASISCTDGSVAAVASVGRVVLVPVAEYGEVPDLTDVNTSTIYVVDANEVVLGEWQSAGVLPPLYGLVSNDGIRQFIIQNNESTQTVEIVRNSGANWVFTEPNCTGDIWTTNSGGSISLIKDPRNNDDLVLYFDPEALAIDPQDTFPLTISTIFESSWPAGGTGCINGQFPGQATLLIPYILPDEILNAAYPLAVIQFD